MLTLLRSRLYIEESLICDSVDDLSARLPLSSQNVEAKVYILYKNFYPCDVFPSVKSSEKN